MKISKVLLAAALVAVSSSAFAGFYVGVNAGASKQRFSVSGYTPLKKTRFLAEIEGGYEFSGEKFNFGISSQMGHIFGKAKTGEDTGDARVKSIRIRSPFHLTLMGTAGFLIKDLEIYAALGAKLFHHSEKYDLELTGAAPADLLGMGASCIKLRPVVGGGLKLNVSQNVFAKVEYNHTFRGKTLPYAKSSEHVIKAGFGYRF